MSLRDTYFPTHEFGIYGPFNENAVRLDGGTVSLKDNKEHLHLGHALIRALFKRDSVSIGKWEVTVVDEDWNWEGEVSLLYEGMFEWIISFESAFDLAVDFAQGLLADEEANEELRDTTFKAFAVIKKVQALAGQESACEQLATQIAVAVLHLLEEGDLVADDNKSLSEVWKEIGEHDDTLSQIVERWLRVHDVPDPVWVDFFVENGLDQSVGKARQRRGQLKRNALKFDSVQELAEHLGRYFALPTKVVDSNNGKAVVVESTNGTPITTIKVHFDASGYRPVAKPKGALQDFREMMFLERFPIGGLIGDTASEEASGWKLEEQTS